MSDSTTSRTFRCAVLSAVKHDYVARGLVSHPRFKPVVVADEPTIPGWAHERNQELADAWNIPYVRDVAAALADFDVDVAIVSPEVERHAKLSLQAIEAGKHLVQDKPLATRRADVEQLRDAVRRQGVRFLMWNRNTLPAMRQARELIGTGNWGPILATHVEFYFAKDAGPPRGSRKLGYPPLDWQAHQIAAHADGSDGGLGHDPLGELAIEGIYPLAYLRMLTGRQVRRVFALCSSHFHQLYVDHQVEDLASLTLELDDGSVATVCLGRIGASSHPSGGEIKIRLVGERGALIIGESRPELLLAYRDQPQRESRLKRLGVEYDLLLAEQMAQAIDEGNETPLDIDASREIFLTVEAALESNRTGRPVDVN